MNHATRRVCEQVASLTTMMQTMKQHLLLQAALQIAVHGKCH